MIMIVKIWSRLWKIIKNYPYFTYIFIANKMSVLYLSSRRYIHRYALRKKISIALRGEKVVSLWNASVSVKMRARRHNHKPRYICMRANEKPISTTIPSRIQQKVRQETKRREKQGQRKKKERKKNPLASLISDPLVSSPKRQTTAGKLGVSALLIDRNI